MTFCKNAYDAAKDSDALVIATEWNEFRNLDFERLKGLLRNSVLLDLKNVYDPERIRKMGFVYVGVGRG